MTNADLQYYASDAALGYMGDQLRADIAAMAKELLEHRETLCKYISEGSKRNQLGNPERTV